MYGRYGGQSFGLIARQIRNHLGTAYSNVRHIATQIDRGVSTAARIYAHVNPILQDIAPEMEKRVTRGVREYKSSYDALRGDAVAIDQRASGYAERLRGVPEMLGL